MFSLWMKCVWISSGCCCHRPSVSTLLYFFVPLFCQQFSLSALSWKAVCANFALTGCCRLKPFENVLDSEAKLGLYLFLLSAVSVVSLKLSLLPSLHRLSIPITVCLCLHFNLHFTFLHQRTQLSSFSVSPIHRLCEDAGKVQMPPKLWHF